MYRRPVARRQRLLLRLHRLLRYTTATTNALLLPLRQGRRPRRDPDPRPGRVPHRGRGLKPPVIGCSRIDDRRTSIPCGGRLRRFGVNNGHLYAAGGPQVNNIVIATTSDSTLRPTPGRRSRSAQRRRCAGLSGNRGQAVDIRWLQSLPGFGRISFIGSTGVEFPRPPTPCRCMIRLLTAGKRAISERAALIPGWD